MTCLKPETAQPGASKPGRDFNPFDVMAPRAPGAIPKDMKNGGRVLINNVRPEGVYLVGHLLLDQRDNQSLTLIGQRHRLVMGAVAATPPLPAIHILAVRLAGDVHVGDAPQHEPPHDGLSFGLR